MDCGNESEISVKAYTLFGTEVQFSGTVREGPTDSDSIAYSVGEGV